MAPLGDDMSDRRVVDDMRKALARMRRVERHERAARLENSEQPDEQIMKQMIFTFEVGMPMAAAAGKKPPVARTQLPKLVRESR